MRNESDISRYGAVPAYKATAGFPSPADDYIDRGLDLNAYLVKHPAATYFVRVSGCVIADSGILDGDILVVDRSCEPSKGDLAIMVEGNEFVLRKVWVSKKDTAGNNINISCTGADPMIWGIVKHVIRSL